MVKSLSENFKKYLFQNYRVSSYLNEVSHHYIETSLLYVKRLYQQNLYTEPIVEPMVNFTDPFFSELIFKGDSLNLLRNELTFRYRYSLRLRGLDELNF